VKGKNKTLNAANMNRRGEKYQTDETRQAWTSNKKLKCMKNPHLDGCE
jgi:hypothetical protein